MTKIKFKDLSGWLQTLAVMGWCMVGIYALVFLVTFIAILLGV